jgi:hypothetical protein
MRDSVLNKFVTRLPEPEATVAAESDELDDLGTFGYLRGVRDRAIMLELRHRSGNVTALGYAWLERAEFNPSEGITLHFSGKTIRITGRNLNAEVRPNVRLFAAILRHRVPWIQEAGSAAVMEAKKNATIIEEFEVKG